jgi:UPF0755 protein
VRRKARSSGWLSLFLILLFAGTAGLVYWQAFAPAAAQSTRFLVRSGQGVRETGDSLRARGIITSSPLFSAMSRLIGTDRRLKPGRYVLPTRASEYRILRILACGGEQTALVTVPEGFTIRQIAARLAREEVCDSASFIAACRDTALLRRWRIPGATAEGYLFPDSYFLPYGIEPEAIVQMMHRRFLEVVKPLLPASQPPDPDPGSLPPDAVILASLVEAEAEQDTERPLVASVFLNRLKRGMRLQSCATVEYVLPQRKAVLSQSDTRFESPYNTYLHAGLPPGPICNPGRSSLQAALHPARTSYLFFVARGGGRHYFSSSFSEHVAAQRRYGQRPPTGVR